MATMRGMLIICLCIGVLLFCANNSEATSGGHQKCAKCYEVNGHKVCKPCSAKTGRRVRECHGDHCNKSRKYDIHH